jgi:hypothetical protein
MLKGVDFFSEINNCRSLKINQKINGQFTLPWGQNIYQWLHGPHGGWAVAS